MSSKEIPARRRAVFIEPYCGGSHDQFLQTVTAATSDRFEWTVLSLPGRHWQMRMATSAAWFAGEIRRRRLDQHCPDVIFCSSFLPLGELLGLVSEWSAARRVMFFHENQLAYTGGDQPRKPDWQAGLAQLTSSLSCDRVLWNSRFNLDSFMQSARFILKRYRDSSDLGWLDELAAKSRVVGLPLDFSRVRSFVDSPPPAWIKGRDHSCPLFLWNHRWEAEKDPAALVSAVARLYPQRRFQLAVCGLQGSRSNADLERLPGIMGADLLVFGELEAERYEALPAACDAVISTARQEFFGISVMEAVAAGALPVVPDRLVYPELYPDGCLYGEEGSGRPTLAERLGQLVDDYQQKNEHLQKFQAETWQRWQADKVLPVIAAELIGAD